ncbi:MAG: D-alanine--D-alanine ligase [Candidatus Omnitrophota bacterium]
MISDAVLNDISIGRVAVLSGGPSNERGISLVSGRAVYDALKQSGCDAVLLEIDDASFGQDLKRLEIDVVFLALHGRFGEDGTIQEMLEGLGIPYTGSGPRASRCALDKIASKGIFEKSGINTPRYAVLEKGRDDRYADSISRLGLPLVVKPQFEGSSIGISVVRDRSQLDEAVRSAFTYGDRILAEEFIEGRELTVGILNDEPLPVVEITAEGGFYNFNAKYESKKTGYIVPARISEEEYKISQDTARKAHLSLGCRFFSRVDMRMDSAGKIFVLEVNTIPGLTGRSLLPKAAQNKGIDFNRLCLLLTKAAKAAHEKKNFI